MRRRARHTTSWTSILAFVAACANDDARTHVYRSSPPARPVPASSGTAAANVAAEIPVGSSGPSARVVSVRLASTGEPAALERLTEGVDVVTLVSRGAGSSPAGPARLELRLTGAHDTTLVALLASPIPRVVAHSFHVGAPDGSVGLPSGQYQLQVRLVGPSGRRVVSAPVSLGVRHP